MLNFYYNGGWVGSLQHVNMSPRIRISQCELMKDMLGKAGHNRAEQMQTINHSADKNNLLFTVMAYRVQSNIC